MLKAYYYLTKPGIIYGNLLTTAAGFLLAAQGDIKFGLLLAVLLGTAFSIGSACVFNNFIDRDIDKKMARTQKRALVSGAVSGLSALAFASVLGLLGFLTLLLFTNLLTVAVGMTGVFFYLVLYSIAKRHSTLGTVVGSIPGATPPVAGYVAVSNSFDLTAALLFLILVLWQMPHFYSIAIFRRREYAAANVPVLSVKKGVETTKLYILAYIPLFIIACLALGVFGPAGLTYMVVMAGVGSFWLWLGIRGFEAEDAERWARSMFGFSLIILMTFSAIVSVAWLLP